MNKISDNHSISYSQKKNLLNLIKSSLENLYDFIEHFEDENEDENDLGEEDLDFDDNEDEEEK